MAVLKASDVKKSFGKYEALKGVSLEVNAGDFISILGPSGSGKSTLLTILGGMDRADGGTVEFEGRKINDMKEKELAALRRTKVGFVFQFFNLAPYLTVEENILLPIVLDGKNAKNYREKFDYLIKYLKIENLTDKLPSELSGGEQQRTAIARALIYEPDIIFLDEPTGNLDSASAEEIMRLLKRVNEELKTTVLQVTHSEKNAAFGNRIIRISDGLIIEDVYIAGPACGEELMVNSEEEGMSEQARSEEVTGNSEAEGASEQACGEEAKVNSEE